MSVMCVTRAILIILALLLALAPAAEARRSVPQGFYGVMWDRAGAFAPEGDQDAQMALMARSGVESVRTTFSWAAAQPQPGAFDFQYTDALVARASRRRLRVLPVVINAPPWAREDPAVEGSPPRNPEDYAAYLRALIGRYGPAGSFWAQRPDVPRRPLREWQIWNEPHLSGFWTTSGPWEQSYTDLLRSAHAATKQADSGARVVLASLADYSTRHLQKVYDQGGRGLFDVMAMNLYTAKPRNLVTGVRNVRRVLRRNGNARMPIWLTEITWPAAKGRDRPRARWQYAWYQTDRGMATRLRQAYDVLVKYRRSTGLGRAYWYTWSSGYRRGDLFDYGGLLHYNGAIFRPRPALRAYRRSARRHQGCAKTSTGRCR